MQKTQPQSNQRRGFFKQFLAGSAVLGGLFAGNAVASVTESASVYDVLEADKWFARIKGKHKIIFDVTQPHELFPFSMPRTFLLANEKTGTPPDECGVVVVLRHKATVYALGNALWEKYKFGEMFKINDADDKLPATQNPFWEPKPGTYTTGSLGDLHIGINELQASGVMFCVCDLALTTFSAKIAEKTKVTADEVKKELMASLLPGIQPAPSGLWAVGRAQEHGCGYCFVA
jgi:intracellular sulfur oxidation DsrE/DsrF family protein